MSKIEKHIKKNNLNIYKIKHSKRIEYLVVNSDITEERLKVITDKRDRELD